MAQCDLCDFQTDSRERYAGHRSAHVRRGELPKRAPRPNNHTCKVCSKNFASGPALGAHVRKHTHWTPTRLAQLLSANGKGSPRLALIRSGRKYRCEICGLGPTWNDQPLTLQVDHINGNNTDHRPENLRFLCPNCHTQTPTYGSKRGTKKKFIHETSASEVNFASSVEDDQIAVQVLVAVGSSPTFPTG